MKIPKRRFTRYFWRVYMFIIGKACCSFFLRRVLQDDVFVIDWFQFTNQTFFDVLVGGCERKFIYSN